jgi:hypothetical protein
MKRPTKEKYPWKPQSTIMPEGLSTIGAIPFYPNLKSTFERIASCLVFTYLEIHHPAPPDAPGRISSLPVTVPVNTMCQDLQVTRRTLALALFPLSTLYTSEASRWSAARAAREFIQPNHSRLGRFKPYSIVSANKLAHSHELVLRRNLPLIRTISQKAGMTQGFPNVFAATPPNTQADSQECRKVGVAMPTLLQSPESLAEILMRASTLSQDRRKVRYTRLRKAVESGLEPASVLSAKQSKGKRRKLNNVGVDPQLPDDVAARLINLQKRDG